ncbi:ArsR/SmtB family transcription factor [Streptococcus sp. S784/96/1]|uniref:ArsR/SmtB family transcription factor n=1 Tax=Streptococcus sp. S784/96/1 TaxID=2653499 RepID=UPI00138A56B8|nr:winged helix-turn-helix transcriptional regulator [Streptococcus sp. S784/96/1]
MGFIINHYRNRIEDFLRVPAMVARGESDWLADLNAKQQTVLTDVSSDYERLYQSLQPLRRELLETGLFEPMWVGLAPLLYLYLLGKGYDPQTESDFLELLSGLSVEQFREALAMRLGTEPKVQHLLATLETSDRSPEVKWYWYQAIQHPEKTRDELVWVLRQVFEIYTPFYERYENEVIAAEKAYAEEAEKSSEHQDIQVIILSPWMLEYYDGMVPYANQKRLVKGCRVDSLLACREVMDDDRLTLLLKTMGDKSRYQVLLALLFPNAKNKDIAEQLGITTASVSFHTQKLLNSGLIKVTQGQGYQINDAVVSQLLEKLQKDLGIKRLDKKA